MTLRLFVGIEVDDAVRAAAAKEAERLRTLGYAGRIEAPEKYHLTVAFLGRVAPERLGEVERALAASAQGLSAFDIVLDRLGAFPSDRRPKVVWLGPSSTPPAYERLAARVRGEFERLGFSFDNEAVAHVTLARLKRPAPQLHETRPAVVTSAAVRALTLFESLPDGRTTRYQIRAQAPLR